MKILVINTGSSSLKYQLFQSQDMTLLAKGNVEHIGEKLSSVKNHTEALQSLLNTMLEAGSLKIEAGKFNVDAIGHRVVHGGEYFKNPVLITDDVIYKITKCIDLAPLHNPANLEVISACQKLIADVPQIAVFDTAFHQTMEPAHYLYPLPMKYYDTYKIRRYGFHGTSHQYVYEQLLANYELGITNSKKPANKFKVITCHVGNGASIAAIVDGKVVETSMGMTPLEGVMMGTRSGNIDSAIIPYLMKHESLTVDQVMNILNKESGVLGISGISNDMRDIYAGVEKGNNRCQLALDMYINALVKYIGSYIAMLGGVDVIVLTGGVMEHKALIRTLLMEKFSWLGITLDETLNQNELPDGAVISTTDSHVKVVVIPTNEELMIARETFKIVNN